MQIQGFFDIPCDQLFANKSICEYLKSEKDFDPKEYVIVAADVGEAKHLSYYANRLALPIAIIDKRRRGNTDQSIATNLIGEVQGKKSHYYR